MEMIFLNKENNKKVRIKVRLSEEENEKLNTPCSIILFTRSLKRNLLVTFI